MENSGTGGSSGQSKDSVILTRKRPSDVLNSLKIECLDRTNSYNPAVVEAKDQALIEQFGLRSSPSNQMHLFADMNAARVSAQLQLQRQYIRNIYQFTLDQRYVLLDPMDIVSISDSGLGLDKQWVRITEITENDDGSLSIVAEEYLAGTGSSPLYSYQQGQGFVSNYNAIAGNANQPVIFEPTAELAESLEVWIGVSGGALWGGADVYISNDGNSYKNVGRITGSARTGKLSSSLASVTRNNTGQTIDTLNTLASGPSAPGSPEAGQLWHDTTNNIIKIRSLDNTTWIVLFGLNETTYLSSLPSLNSPAFVTPTRTTSPAPNTASSQLADMNAVQSSQLGIVNRVINGSMLIAHRGVSGVVVAGTPAMCLDMFQLSCTGANITWGQGTVILSNGSPVGLSITGNTGITSTTLKHRIEGYQFFPDGSQLSITASIYNQTGATITPTLTIRRPSSPDNYSTTTTDLAAVNLQAIANNMTGRVSYTYTAASFSYYGLEIAFDFGAALNANTKAIGVSDVDVRVMPGVSTGLNNNPPIPEMRPFALENMLCQRYIETSYQPGILPGATNQLGKGETAQIAFSTTQFYGFAYSAQQFKVNKRTIPTLAFYNPSTGAVNTFWNYSSGIVSGILSSPTASINQFGYTGTSISGGAAYGIHWVATAELF